MNWASTNWYKGICDEGVFEQQEHSKKLLLLFSILKKCQEKEEKLVVFAEYLSTLDVIEHFLSKMNNDSNKGEIVLSWIRGLDYFRMDGSTDVFTRKINCDEFNNTHKKRAR